MTYSLEVKQLVRFPYCRIYRSFANSIVQDPQILHTLAAHFPSMALRTYYVKREEAIEVVSSMLWGYTSQECRAILASYEDCLDTQL